MTAQVPGVSLPGLEGVPLSFVERVLLTTDGTVTNVLAAYAGERVVVDKLAQARVHCDDMAGELQLDPRDLVLQRTILLRGTSSGRSLLYAESVISDRFPEGLLQELMERDRPIGQLMADSRLETFREISAWGCQPAAGCARYFGINPDAPVLWRRYRVFSRLLPLMAITEKFPVGAYASPPDAATSVLSTDEAFS